MAARLCLRRRKPIPSLPILTNASQVLSLPAEQAILGESIRVTGVVTSAEPGWEGRFFVQDQSGGIFVENLGAAPPQPGDLVEVSGISHPGAFAPIITRPQWKKLGTAPLPPPKTVPIEQLMAGVEDSQRVEVMGIVREAAVEGTRLRVTLANGGYRLRAYLPVPRRTWIRKVLLVRRCAFEEPPPLPSMRSYGI